MNAAESLSILYKIICDLKGPLAAKEFLECEMKLVIYAIQEENLPITAEEIDRRLEKEANDFKEISEKNKKSIA